MPGGRISPSVSEADLNHPTDSISKDIIHAVSTSYGSSLQSHKVLVISKRHVVISLMVFITHILHTIKTYVIIIAQGIQATWSN